jgi:hypothetical protein
VGAFGTDWQLCPPNQKEEKRTVSCATHSHRGCLAERD